MGAPPWRGPTPSPSPAAPPRRRAPAAAAGPVASPRQRKVAVPVALAVALHAVRDGLQGVARGLGERVVDDDEVAVEAWMVLEEGTEHDEGARDEGFGGGGGEADAGCGGGLHRRDGKAQLSCCTGSRTVGSASGRSRVAGGFSISNAICARLDFAVHCPDGRLGPRLLRRIARRGRVRISYRGGGYFSPSFLLSSPRGAPAASPAASSTPACNLYPKHCSADERWRLLRPSLSVQLAL